jgi:hypothetical protein
MNGKAIWIGALALPMLALAAAWANTHHMAQQGTDWDVPVSGYDPRDPLRGHYIRYQYDWPFPEVAAKEGEEAVDFQPFETAPVCLTGTSPNIATARLIKDSQDEAGCTSIVRRNDWAESDGEDGAHRDRLYVPQAKAADMEAKLRDEKLQAIIRIRVRPDGVATPQSMSFRPRPATAKE